jgi:hypothetical protein
MRIDDLFYQAHYAPETDCYGDNMVEVVCFRNGKPVDRHTFSHAIASIDEVVFDMDENIRRKEKHNANAI